MKYLQHGVYRAGLSNQLMSLELGVGLAYLTNRVLVPDVERIPSGQMLIRGTEAPRILDLFDIPNPVIMPGQRIPADGSDLVRRDFDGNLVTTAFFFPSDLDTNSDDARAFADGRPLKTFDDSLQMADVIRLHWRSTLGFYSYVFYVPESRERLFKVIRRIRPKKYYIAFAAAIKAAIGSTFNAVHIRRTDFRKENPAWVHPSPGAILENMLTVLPREELLLLCTDEPCRSWFGPILAEYKNHLFLDDFILMNNEFSRLPFSGNAVQALITMMVAAQSDRFMGTLLSTFTSIIQRWRGQNGKALSFQYIYNPLGEYFQFQRGQLVETRSGPYSWNRLEKHGVPWSWAREWPESLSEIHRLVTIEQEKLTRRSPAKTAPGTRPEIKLLLCCARTCVDVKNAEQIRTMLREDIDWGDLIQTASQHRVLPLLYSSLKSSCPEAVPNAILDQLQRHFHTNALHNFLLTEELLKLLTLFQTHGIRAIPYKGPALAVSVYGNLLLRQFTDLDILVRERDYQRAQHLLIAQGFRLTIEHEWEKEFVNDRGRRRVAVDLHRRIAPREFPSPLTFEYLSKRLRPIMLGGRIVATLCPEDTLLMLCIQVTKDRCRQLAKICDIAELVRVHRSLNWAHTLKETKKLGAQRKILFGLCLTSNVLGTALPQEVVHELRFHKSIHQLVEYASQQFFPRGDHTVRDQLTSQRFRWLIRERLRDRLYPYLRYLHAVIVPCELDRRLLPLPRRLSFLYYFIRPIRMARKYGLLFLRRVYDFGEITIYRHMTKKPVVVGARSEPKSPS